MQHLKLLLGFLSLVIFTGCSNEIPRYLVDKSSGCKIWTLNKQAKSVVWSGQCKNGYASGKGRVILPDDDSKLFYGYVNYLDGNLNGYCKVEEANFGEYKGELKNGKFNGQGTYNFY